MILILLISSEVIDAASPALHSIIEATTQKPFGRNLVSSMTDSLQMMFDWMEMEDRRWSWGESDFAGLPVMWVTFRGKVNVIKALMTMISLRALFGGTGQ